MAEKSKFEAASLGAKGVSNPESPRSPFGKAEEQDRLLEVLRAGRVVSYEWDLASDVVVRSANAIELFGFEANEVTGENFFKGIDPEDREKVSSAIRLLTPEKADYAVSYRYCRAKDGRELVLEDTGRGEFDSSGSLVRVRGLARDVTEQKRAEANEQRLRTLLDHNPSLVFMKDEAGRYVYLNEAYERQFVHSKDWFGKTDFDFWPREAAELFLRDDAEVLRCGETKQFMEDSRDLTGKRYCWLCYKFPFTGSDGKRYVGGVGIDATRQVEAEEVARESEELFRLMFTDSSVGKAQADPATGRFVKVNAALCRITGYSEQELLERTFHDLTHPEDRERDRERFRRLVSGEIGSYTCEKRYVRPDGEIVWADVTLNLVRDAAGGPVRSFAVIQDVTARKRAEEAVRRSEEENRRLVQHLHAGVVVHDAETRILWANVQACSMLALTHDQIMGKTAVDPAWCFVREDLTVMPREEYPVNRVLSSREPLRDLVLGINHPDGGRTWVLVNAFPELDPAGAIGRVVVTFIDLTERKRAEEALRAAEREKSLILDSANAIIASHDLNNNLVWANKAYLDSTGLPLSALKGRKCYACWGLDQICERCPVTEAIRTGLPQERELTPENQPHWSADHGSWLVRAAPVRDNDGVIIGAIEVAYDITERKRAESALREQQRLHKSVTDNAALALFIMDDRQHCVFMNPAAVQLTGYTLEETQGRPLHDVVHHTRPDGRPFPLSECAIDQAFPKNDREQGEEVFVHKDGHFYPVAFTASPMRDASGQPVGTIIEVQDITDRKRAEDALREEQRRLGLAMDAGQLVPWEIDLVTGQVKQSQRLFQFFGLSPDEAFNSRDQWRTLIHEDDRPAILQSVEAAKSGQEHHLEYRIHHPDGRIHWHETHGVPVPDAQGRYVRLVGFARDITERKAFQAELERLVTERTAKLNELVAELEHFSYTITHDMRAPLRAMQGFAEMFVEAYTGGQQQDAQRFLQRIQTAASRMDVLITDALNYNKAVRQDLPLEPVDIGLLLRGMLDTYPELQSSRAQIEIEGELPRVLGNQAGLTQCFSNLLGNAVKFTKPGQRPEIRIWAERRPTPAPTRFQDALPARPPTLNPHPMATAVIRLWVEDNGLGISESMLPRVFDMFSRGTNEQPGTGIGLALVRKVVDRMGGRVGVESQEGQGSRFWLELTPAT
jgi:PAS domain S-box-containing protein